MQMTADELRNRYLQFFKKKGHAIIPSASLMPEIDSTVLFTSAGMHPLVPFLLGQPHPQGRKLVNVQKCLRTDDIEEVGDTCHLTFFEMLGQWSLGDYWKRGAIEMAMEFLINPEVGLGLDKEKLNITLYEGDQQIDRDEEAAQVWEEQGIPQDRIHYLSKKENWWALGDSGPQGPDTEIFVDMGLPLCSKDCRPGCGCGKFVEIWNLVFMGYNKNEDGTLTELEQKNIDTGMGLERALQVINGLPSVFETEVFAPIMTKIESIARIKEHTPEKTRIMRIIADHLRSAVMALADDYGLVPSNVEHGYVIRRLLRVAIRRGIQLGIERSFLQELVPIVQDVLGATYPEVNKNQEHVLTQIKTEEERFRKALRRGLRITQRILADKGTLTGKDAFLLFSSYGFPVEMTANIAQEHGVQINLDEFREEFERHQQISRGATDQRFASGLADHSEEVIRLHTATHLFHSALRKIISSTIYQKGSNITRERLRLDVFLDRKLTPEELQKVENWVNDVIQQDLKVNAILMTPGKAEEQGALGFFEDKYGDQVKVYSIGDVSKEICSGPHVERTGVLGTFRIVKQRRIGADTLRLRAILESLKKEETKG